MIEMDQFTILSNLTSYYLLAWDFRKILKSNNIVNFNYRHEDYRVNSFKERLYRFILYQFNKLSCATCAT